MWLWPTNVVLWVVILILFIMEDLTNWCYYNTYPACDAVLYMKEVIKCCGRSLTKLDRVFVPTTSSLCTINYCKPTGLEKNRTKKATVSKLFTSTLLFKQCFQHVPINYTLFAFRVEILLKIFMCFLEVSFSINIPRNNRLPEQDNTINKIA